MKKILVLCATLTHVILLFAQNTQLTSSEQNRIVERVKEYCNLMQAFSGDIEQIEKMEEIIAMCENNKVQTFDDLSQKEKSSNVEYNSYPLFQYLQNITTQYDNSLQVSYSDFKCEKVLSEPAINEEIAGNSYALVHVVKKIKGEGINKSVPLKITINILSMKIGGTISEEYEDPYSLYLQGMEYREKGKYEKAIECLKKSASYKTYAGRYRAMSLIGSIYFVQERWHEAVDMLKKASEQDPLGGIMLAQIYLNQNTPFDLQKPYEAMQLLDKYATVKDKEFPWIHTAANFLLASLYMQGEIIPQNLEKGEEYLQKVSSQYNTKDPVDRSLGNLGNVMLATIYVLREQYTAAISTLQILELSLNLYPIPANQAQQILTIVYSLSATSYGAIGDDEKMEEYIHKVKNLDTEEGLNQIATLYRNKKRYDEAISYYRLAAERGNASAAIIMSDYYMPELTASDDNDGFAEYLMLSRPDKSNKQAYEWAKIAAERGDKEGAYRLAVYYLNGSEDVTQNWPEFIKWGCIFSDRVAYGDRRFAAIGSKILDLIIDSDQNILLNKLHEQAEENSPSANYFASWLYEDEKFSQCDIIRANEYLRKSAELGYHYACFDFANNSLTGHGTPIDIQTAYYYYKKLAGKNIPEGISALGYFEEEYNQNYSLAKELYLKAFKMKDPHAALSLGTLYLDGKGGIERDLQTAKWYFEQAILFSSGATRYYELARENLEKIEQELAANSMPETYMEKLQTVIDLSLSLEQRISNSETVLNELFASPEAVIKTVGSNGKTIVATEKADDYLMRLCTSGNQLKLKVMNAELDVNGKITTLTVKEEK